MCLSLKIALSVPRANALRPWYTFSWNFQNELRVTIFCTHTGLPHKTSHTNFQPNRRKNSGGGKVWKRTPSPQYWSPWRSSCTLETPANLNKIKKYVFIVILHTFILCFKCCSVETMTHFPRAVHMLYLNVLYKCLSDLRGHHWLGSHWVLPTSQSSVDGGFKCKHWYPVSYATPLHFTQRRIKKYFQKWIK